MNRNDFEFNPGAYNFCLPIQLRFNDIDILGHLNNIVYFSLFDTAKAQYFQAVFNGTWDWNKVETVIANVNCSFINSAYYGENLAIYTRCEEMGLKSFTLRQVLVNLDTMEVKAVCDSVMVSYDPATKRSTPIKESTRSRFEAFEKRAFPLPEA